MKTRFETLASAIVARHHCDVRGNAEWFDRWDRDIREIMATAPSGSGFDAGTTLDDDESNADVLVFRTSYHHMNEDGFYIGWSEWTVTVTPSFANGVNVDVFCHDGTPDDDTDFHSDYIAEVFATWGDE